MEVHTHTHTARKKWTHYFWEFLMLFLAVFCGFLAENLREDRIEHKRADKYIESFYEDLQVDTSKLNRVIKIETRKVKKLEVYKSCYDSLLQNQNPKSFLEIIKNSAFNNAFGPEQRTIRQLFNAGGFRLLKKDDVDSITSYVQRCEIIENFERTAYQQTQDNLRNFFNQFIDFSANASLNSNLSDNPNFDVTSITIPLMATGSKHLLNEYFNTLLQYIRVIVNHRNLLLRVNEKAEGLIEYFKKKYHLK
jgi:hypothetical protein